MSSDSIPRGSSHDIGDFIEHEIVDSLSLKPVPDAEVEWYDAIAEHTISIGLVDLSDTICVEQGTPIEIKGARYRISDGTGTRRGRFYLKQNSHKKLLEAGGVYCSVVYNDDGILAVAWLKPETVDELVGSWSDVDRSHGNVALVNWSAILPPSIVNGGGRK